MSFLAWDMTNGDHCGSNQVNVSVAKTGRFLSEFSGAAVMKQLRVGTYIIFILSAIQVGGVPEPCQGGVRMITFFVSSR